ncbi:hypothetical protein Cgig2_013521 [Carnegiea gigantea]|uniref:PGG domain-containing protein n=1 Tax=Carnegiea gigantea TaxID=171969 RepID=A0A9Q1GNY9_9CARY|nr:hypothetical protein Cgig2_013521 [Carnegiea gigantea]
MEEEPRDRVELLSRRLYDAAIEGNKSSRFNQSPLHVAANFGHLEFAREILRRRPRMAEELDHTQRLSPLHVSSANGHLEIVKALLAVNPNMCLARDQDGRNPVHVAAINGQIHVLGELLGTRPQAAREQTHAGETALHLCVKHSQLEALKFLVHVTDDEELLNSKDSNGNTILHLAVTARQTETVKFLVKDKRMQKNTINTNGLTAMDTCLQRRKDHLDMEIWRSLKRAKALRAKVALRPRNGHRIWLENQRNALMIVASLIATMAFQVGVNPPGGFWQDDSNGHQAGFSVMADKDRGSYHKLLILSTIGLVSSLSVILLLISGLPCRRLFVGILMIAMWIALSATLLTYFASVDFVSNTKIALNTKQPGVVWYVVIISLGVWLLLLVLLHLVHVIRIVVRLIKQMVRLA